MKELTLLLFSPQHTKLQSFFNLNKVVGLRLVVPGLLNFIDQ